MVFYAFLLLCVKSVDSIRVCHFCCASAISSDNMLPVSVVSPVNGLSSNCIVWSSYRCKTTDKACAEVAGNVLTLCFLDKVHKGSIVTRC